MLTFIHESGHWTYLLRNIDLAVNWSHRKSVKNYFLKNHFFCFEINMFYQKTNCYPLLVKTIWLKPPDHSHTYCSNLNTVSQKAHFRSKHHCWPNRCLSRTPKHQHYCAPPPTCFHGRSKSSPTGSPFLRHKRTSPTHILNCFGKCMCQWPGWTKFDTTRKTSRNKSTFYCIFGIVRSFCKWSLLRRVGGPCVRCWWTLLSTSSRRGGIVQKFGGTLNLHDFNPKLRIIWSSNFELPNYNQRPRREHPGRFDVVLKRFP